MADKGEYFTKETARNTGHNLAKTSCEVLQVAGSKGDVSCLDCKSYNKKTPPCKRAQNGV
jgi:hypothetical protein